VTGMKRTKATRSASSLLFVLCSWASGAVAADIVPAPQEQPAPRGEAPAPLQKDVPKPDVGPSQKDSGMVKQPDTVPHPDSVVTPPVVDPKMAVNPEERTHDPMAVPPGGNPVPPPGPSR
jgi:hypothetical protein